MLSGLAFRGRSSSPGISADDKEKKPKEKIKHKHKSKKKSHKKEKADAQGHNSPEPRLSNSPCVSVEQPASDTADPQPDSTAAQEPHAAEWDSLLNRVSDPRQQATGSKEPASQKHSVSQAPRIDNKPSDRIGGGAGGGGSGRVGDGGSGWRRRLQKRQGQDGEALVLNRDRKEQNEKHPHEDRQRFSGTNRDGMRKPQTNASNAFQKPNRHHSRDTDASETPSQQAEREVRRQRSEAEDAPVPPHGRSSTSQAGAAPEQRSAVDPFPSAAAANLSAAAQLKARLRGVPAAELATTSRTDNRERQSGHSRAGSAMQPPQRGRKITAEDEEHLSAAALAKSTRLGHGMDDIDKNFAKNITSKRKFKMNDIDPDDEYDFGVGIDLYTKQKKNKRPEIPAQKQTQPIQASNDHVASRCNLCFMSGKRNKEITLSVGSLAYLALPARGSLVPGHCTIIPVDHVASMRAADSEVVEEVKNFKKCLIQMFQAQDKRCIFMETATRVKESRSHACVECVPVSQDAFSSAPMILRREIDSAESEWSQHHAKRLIETTDRGLNSCIPSNFPYFHVEFGYKKGYVHVIDDEESWDRRFGRSVLASLSGADTVEIYRRAQRDSTTSQSNRKEEFVENWREFDWTQQLEQVGAQDG